MDKTLVSKDNPLTPPDKMKLVSLAKVQESALAVTVSPVASPIVKAPSIPTVPATSRSKSGVESRIPILWLPASTKKMLEILAVIPVELAISKKVSGVESPRENLPREAEEKMENSKAPRSNLKSSI